MADLEDPGYARQERLFSLFINLIKNSDNDHFAISKETLDSTIGSLEMQPIQGGDVVPVSIEEILRRKQENIQFSQDVSKIGLRKFYEGYNDFIISVRSTLVRDKGVDSSVFKIQTVASPGLEAYEPTGFNKLDIYPRLSSYAHIL